MICLGIESTAHTFGCGIINEKGKVYANVKDSFVTVKGGINPMDAKVHHEKVKDKIVEKTLIDSNLKLKDVDLVAFSQGPGIGSCLWVGLNKAVLLAEENKISIVGVNHCISHLEIGKLKIEKVKEEKRDEKIGINKEELIEALKQELGKMNVEVV